MLLLTPLSFSVFCGTRNEIIKNEDKIVGVLVKLPLELERGIFNSTISSHTVRLSDSLSQALELASIPGVRSKSLNMINASPDQIELNRTGNGNPPNTYESRKNRNGSSLGLPAAPFPTNFMSNCQKCVVFDAIRFAVFTKKSYTLSKHLWNCIQLQYLHQFYSSWNFRWWFIF